MLAILDHDQQLNTIQRLLAVNGQFTNPILHADGFSPSSRALLLALAVSLDEKKFRLFLDQFYALGNLVQINEQQHLPHNFNAICISLKTINDICHNNLIWIEHYSKEHNSHSQTKSALLEYLGSNVDAEYWQICAQKIAFDSIAYLRYHPVSKLTEHIDTNELQNLFATGNRDYGWRALPEFNLTATQQQELEPEFYAQVGMNLATIDLNQQLIDMLNAAIHSFLADEVLADGMRIYLLEQAATSAGKKFREVLDHIYNIIGSQHEYALQCLKQINDLCVNNAVFITDGNEFGEHEQAALVAYLGQDLVITSTTQDELLIANRHYVFNVLTSIIEQFTPQALRLEMLQIGKYLSTKLPDPQWRAKRRFKLTLLQVLESPLLDPGLDLATTRQLELIRNEILLAAQQADFVLAKLAAGEQLQQLGLSGRRVKIIHAACQAAMRAGLVKHHAGYAVITASAEMLMLAKEIYSPAKALHTAYRLIDAALRGYNA